MSDQTTQIGSEAPVVEEIEAQPTPQKIFSRSDVKRHVSVSVHLPRLYENYAPWVFKLRLKLSGQAEERRQEYLSLSATQQTAKVSEQALDEICDLLVELPTGFADLQDTGQGPGPSFRSYVESTKETAARELLNTIVEGADNVYWLSITPREFRS